jgi:fructose-1,6-bisphosphatase/inositol monophosphatase family enzyme
VRELMEPVSALLREAAQTTLMPVFGLPAAAPTQKAPGEWVTVADRACEELLTPALAHLLPGSTVVGEEAAHGDPRLLDRVGDGWVWLVDPLDGTANFAAGRRPFAMMVALLHNGSTVAGWIHDPVTGEMFTAERGGGAWRDGHQIRPAHSSHGGGRRSGAVSRRFLPAELGAAVDAGVAGFADVTDAISCAGAAYPRVVLGDWDFVLFWRTLPWDHAAGCLFAEEAGGAARRFDSRPYRPGEHREPGLLVARNRGLWDETAARLLPGAIDPSSSQ